MNGRTFRTGLRDGIPIALGYLLVSAGFGITAVNYGLSVAGAVLISLTNLTSAGQVAGIEILRDFGPASVFAVSALEMLVTQLVINLRYSLMGISLSQKLDGSFTTGKRMLTSFFITDEIYAMAASRRGDISVPYLFGLGTLPVAGWTLGTAVGALTASVLPRDLSNVFGIAIYGMFLSIVIPDCRRQKGVLLCSLLSAALSCLLVYVPAFSGISSGFRVILCAVLSCAVIAAVLPAPEEEEDPSDA